MEAGVQVGERQAEPSGLPELRRQSWEWEARAARIYKAGNRRGVLCPQRKLHGPAEGPSRIPSRTNHCMCVKTLEEIVPSSSKKFTLHETQLWSHLTKLKSHTQEVKTGSKYLNHVSEQSSEIQK